MTNEEAIMILNPETRRETMQKIPVFERIDADQAACRLAVAALRAQAEAEKNEPLTLDELREMDGEPVWVEALGPRRYGAYEVCYGSGEMGVPVEEPDAIVWFLDDWIYAKDYGKTWLAYRHKPEECGK